MGSFRDYIMNATDFIKQHGVDKAREVVEGAPDKTATHYVFRKIPSYYSVEFQSWHHDDEWWDSDCHTEQDLIDSYGDDYVVNLSDLKNLIANIDSQIAIKFIKEWGDDYSKKYIALSESEGNILPWELSLKRLVESVGLVEQFGNDIVGAKRLLAFTKNCKTIELSGSVITTERLKQAIADYELIYSNDMGDDTHIENHVSPNCKVGVK